MNITCWVYITWRGSAEWLQRSYDVNLLNLGLDNFSWSGDKLDTSQAAWKPPPKNGLGSWPRGCDLIDLQDRWCNVSNAGHLFKIFFLLAKKTFKFLNDYFSWGWVKLIWRADCHIKLQLVDSIWSVGTNNSVSIKATTGCRTLLFEIDISKINHNRFKGNFDVPAAPICWTCSHICKVMALEAIHLMCSPGRERRQTRLSFS